MGKKIPLWQSLVTILFTMIALMYCLGILGKVVNMITGIGFDSEETNAFSCGYGEVHIALIASAMFASIVAALNGYKWAFLEAGILASINRSMQAILILLLVGILIGAWVKAGVVPAMIYYGLMILKPSIFLFASCILCMIVSLATGSSWTTAGTIGIALIGVGTGLGIPVAMTGGAIVSGAYFGDKMSPLSDTTNLAPAMAGATLFDHIRHMIFTVTPSILIALVIYLFLGFKYSSGGADTQAIINGMQEAIKLNFNINPAMLIPPVVVIVIVALKIPALPGLMGGVILGCIIGSIFQGVPMGDWPSILHYGYNVENFSDAFMAAQDKIGEGPLLEIGNKDFADFASEFNLSQSVIAEYNIGALINGKGGMSSMLWTVNLILCAMCFGGVMDASGMLGSLAQSLLKIAKNTGLLVTVTVFSCIFVNIIAGDQYLSLVLPGRMYKEAFEDRRLAPKNLSRVLEDSGTITSNLVPWNTCGATMSNFLGVPQYGPEGYVKYAFLCFINPLISIFYGFTGITMEKMSEEDYQKILKQREQERSEALAALEA